MIVRYGKEVQMKKISRDLKAIRTAIEFDRQSFEKYYKAPLKNIKPKCRICGSEQAELFVKIWGKYDYYRCEKCKSIFLHNLPDIEQMYSCDTDSANGDIYIDDDIYEQRVEMISAPKVKFVLEVCKEVKCEMLDWLN